MRFARSILVDLEGHNKNRYKLYRTKVELGRYLQIVDEFAHR